MNKIAKLPEALAAALIEASAKIGPERALIALQGIVQHSKPLRIIDGVMRQETIDAVEKAVAVSGLDTLVLAFVEKIEARFPGTFEVDEDAIDGEQPVAEETIDPEDLQPVIAPRRKKRVDG